MSERLRMVHLRTVPDAWHARVLAARLGCEGIVTHLEGNLSGPYPFGAVRVFVEADQAELAAELLLADEVEAALSSVPARQGAPVSTPSAPMLLGDSDDALSGPPDQEPADVPPSRAHAMAGVRLRRAAAALVVVALAGAGVLAHFVS